jgi:hypothetical protein
LKKTGLIILECPWQAGRDMGRWQDGDDAYLFSSSYVEKSVSYCKKKT